VKNSAIMPAVGSSTWRSSACSSGTLSMSCAQERAGVGQIVLMDVLFGFRVFQESE
jgi:hypothetical protein